jgi:hypothetical protein
MSFPFGCASWPRLRGIGEGVIERAERALARRRDVESDQRSWDLHFAYAGDGGSFGDVGRQQSQRVLLTRRFDRPPDRVAAGAARGKGRSVTERAVVTLERLEHDAALTWQVPMLEEEAGHASSFPRRAAADIGRTA